MAKYLITGGAGFIGNNFIKYMMDKYPTASFVCLDLLTYASTLDSLEEVMDKSNFKFVHGDICDVDLVDDLFKNESFDYVINFAAESHVDRSFIYTDLFYKTNVEGTRVLLEASKKYNVKRFHQVSTDEVYGELELTDKTSFSEVSQVNPTTPYSKSKAMADELCLKYFNEYKLNITISRSTNNFGCYQHPEKLIPKVVKMALNNENITVYGDGSNVRDWMFVLDHCNAIDLIIHNGIDGEIYNVGANQEFANIDIINKVLNVLDIKNPNITYVNGRVYDDKRYSLNCDKIKQELNWKTSFEFNECFYNTVMWFKNNFYWINKILIKKDE